MKQVNVKQLQPGDRLVGTREFVTVVDGQFVVREISSAEVRATPQPIALGQWEVITNKGILRMSGESLLRVRQAEASLPS